MKKRDLILISSILAIALTALGCFYGLGALHHNTDSLLRITLNGSVIRELPIDQNYSETIVSDDENTNLIVIENGKVFVKSSNCQNQICVNSRPISAVGETIACLPHQLILEITQDH
ncbi:MAG: NusG domain II-containing protein [Eubacterium sp.]